MLRRCMLANFLMKHEKFIKHASEIFTKHRSNVGNFVKKNIVFEKFDFITILLWTIR